MIQDFFTKADQMNTLQGNAGFVFFFGVEAWEFYRDREAGVPRKKTGVF